MKARLGPRRAGVITITNLLVLALLAGCLGQAAPPPIRPSPVFEILPTATAEPGDAYAILNFVDAVPPALRERVQGVLLPAGTQLSLAVAAGPGLPDTPNQFQLQWVYALVAPFPTVRDDVTAEALRAAWTAGPSPDLFGGRPLLMEAATLAAFTDLWGAPASGAVRAVESQWLVDTAWSESTWAIVPFEDLSPRWKTLTIDGQAPTRKGFEAATYPLTVPFTLQTSGTVDPAAFNLARSNYDPARLTTVVLTGVTALVRATAYRMEQKGVTYPGEVVRDVLREADIAHISNEIPFMTGCPEPDPNSQRLVFCSDPKYMELLTDVGTDVVELTGNHFADYGRAAMEETLSLYRANNLPYFGGGADLQDAFQPALFDIHGNKIAFLGCNAPDVDGPKVASESGSGAAPCDFDYFTAKILELKQQGYFVFFTFQWFEDYAAPPNPQQVDDFYRVADAGANVVSGSQAHYAKVMEFYRDSFLHYGLGNLFFDQMGNFDWMPAGIRREFLDRYVLYDGRLVGVELITALLEDFSRPRLMTPEERSAFLQDYFEASGWVTSDPAPAGTSGP